MGHHRTLYDILEIDLHADVVTIWVAYDRLSKRYNPLLPENADDPSVAEQYQRIRTAYLTLSNPATRARYNRSLEEPEIRSESAAAAAGPASPQWISASLIAMAAALVLAAWYLTGR